ncbi:splicing factor U2AF small subunit, putative [Plasmodium knowlesi strain H]|uniref:Splicing factor U2AF small subunit, putative n=3 Tax=Plasmodium knowlesi TaxID=5850 RepID=A0A5K1VR00_PLAKH|nr:splicing factor U2AF small subunit, putative [Plasmodium knowlesi strain H]OTN64893.1 putative Splicing factor U2AF small subunit [Plasmodium knowlesi]CAA9988217.1 splicing factor U2AF small subunit, putative [Plasmodium knowlesi strain H]SBO20142.1 splicing factor U2AF small subunit, putative [Plasmodium knowlesi strain H]SBO20577.1 splicing factor U2AF small subunit, putative [Plasmodium knowlesi strain H]VVS77691.1 splicing factor U2AF small subunit, putative [Plasmodium knowlesi strain |eukprot:XP_002259194.1 U2 snRNP auxiliary factor, small subunit,putative [Plasmodium knowlesi strain H]
MAEHLARIIGTEEDRVNCPFFWKIGACRHGDQCSRSHYKPNSAQTLVIRHMYDNPPMAVAIAEGQMVEDEVLDKAADHFEEFYEEVFEELMKYGEIEDMVVCDNIGDHIIGNVYIKYTHEDYAEKAVKELNGRFYAGKPLQIEYTPVTDFREARCRQFVDGQCRRGGYCNFMHIKHVPRSVKRKLYKRMYKKFPEYKKRRKTKDGSEDGHYDSHRDRGTRDKHRRDKYGDSYHSSRRRNRSRSRSRNRDDADGDSDGASRRHKYPRRENSAERREKIERWNKEREMKNMQKDDDDEQHASQEDPVGNV